LGTRGKVARA